MQRNASAVANTEQESASDEQVATVVYKLAHVMRQRTEVTSEELKTYREMIGAFAARNGHDVPPKVVEGGVEELREWLAVVLEDHKEKEPPRKRGKGKATAGSRRRRVEEEEDEAD